MKMIYAVVRPRSMGPTKDALDAMGFPCMTAIPVLGRGKQRGLVDEVDVEMRPDVMAQCRFRTMKYVPKRLMTIVVPDADVDTVVQAILDINHTGHIGDGRIFICPVEDALRVRTAEQGEQAIL